MIFKILFVFTFQMSNLSKINQNFIQIFNDILLNTDITQKKSISKYLKTLNGNTLWKLFEYKQCISNNVIPWDLLSFDQKEQLKLKDIYRDFGIDGISNDFITSLQCKYRDNTSITFREISTFYHLSDIIGCKHLILDMLNTSKYHR